MATTTDILVAIDTAIGDSSVGPDAMRCNAVRPEKRAPRRPEAMRVLREIPGDYYPFGEGPGFTVGQIVYRYHGPMYGCMAPGEIAVCAVPDEAPFWGVPADALEDWQAEREVMERLRARCDESARAAAWRMIADAYEED